MSIFSKVKADYQATSIFNLSHEVKNTMKFGQLIPFLTQEVLPGDIWRVKTEILTRLLQMKAPLMHNVNVYTHFFFVPYRLIWDKWEQFVTESLNGTYKADVSQLPLISLSSFLGTGDAVGAGSLLDHLGFKMSIDHVESGGSIDNMNINALPLLAYHKIWQDYYRDENLDDDIPEEWFELPQGVTDIFQNVGGKKIYAPMILKHYRAFAKDYFTSALPWTQKGADVTLPIGGSAPISGVTNSTNLVSPLFAFNPGNGDNRVNPFPVSGHDLYINRSSVDVNKGYLTSDTVSGSDGVVGVGLQIPSVNISGTADLSNATAVTINELRRANALQRWEEMNARGGTRYIEQLLSHFGVVSDDARLQRAEYLGGGKSPIVISEVLQTSQTTDGADGSAQGTMTGHGVSASRNHAFKRRFKEHGILMGIMSVMPKSNYMQGCPRMFLKRDVFDFGWPVLSHLGEQPIYPQELYNDGIPVDMSNVPEFGYTPRYAEYKFIPDQIAGEFRTSLEYWTLARKFGNAPKLNSQFISSKGLSDNPGAFPTGVSDYILNDMYLDIKAIRKLPKYGTPRL